MFFANENTNAGVLSGNVIGTQIVPGTNSTWGAWTVAIAGAANTRGASWHRTNIQRYNASATDRRLFVDMGMRPAGAAGSEITLVPRLVGSKAGDNQVYWGCGIEYGGPIAIPAGYDVVYRGMSNQPAATDFYVLTTIGTDPVFNVPFGMACEVLGANDAAVQGTDVVPFDNGFHVSSGYGTAWTLIGTTTRQSQWIDASLVRTGNAADSRWFAMQLAAGTATDKTVIATGGLWSFGDVMARKRDFTRKFQAIPPGTNIYAQVACQTSAVTCAVTVYNYF